MMIHLLVLLATGYVQGATLPDANTRIVGGKEAPEDAFPYQVSMRNVEGNDHFCGGSIIGKKWILTAAHCLTDCNPDSFVIVVGTNDVSSGGKQYKVDSFIKHENYVNDSILIFDICLIKLTEEIEYTDKIQPIEIDDTYVDGGEKCTITGWGYMFNGYGRPDKLQMLDVTVLPVSKCKEKLKNVKPAQYTEDKICVFAGQNKGFCQGDSGGPLARNKKQVGVVSYNIPCGQGYPDVYTRLSSYVDWIKKNTGE